MDYTPPAYAWYYVIAAAVLLLIFLLRRSGWPVIVLALSMQAPPDLRAILDSPTSATVTWTAERRLCLSYSGAFAGCYAAGRNVVTFGKAGSLSGDLRSRAGGVYSLSDSLTGQAWHAPPLVGPVYLALVKR